MMEIIFISLAIISLMYAFIEWMTTYYKYFELKQVKHLKPIYLLGNTLGLFAGKYAPQEYIQKIYQTFPNEKIIGLFDFRKPFFFIRDPDVLKKLTIKDFDHFADHRAFLPDNCDRLFGNSLFMLRGDKWRDMRATLSPAFTGSKMRQMFELVTECAADMSTYFMEKIASAKSIDLEMKDVFSRYTNDVIASCAFGIKSDSFRDENNDFLIAGKYISNFTSFRNVIKLLCMRIAPSVMRFLNIEFIDGHIRTFFKSMVLGNIETREKQGIFRPDMINIMMQIKKGSSIKDDAKDHKEEKKIDDGFATVAESSVGQKAISRKWSDDELAAQCFLFFAAGFDTSSTLLSFAAYELAINLDIQHKLYEEINDVNTQLNGKRISYDLLQKMTYLDMVISETLRKWPPAPFTDRLCIKDYEYEDDEKRFLIEKGMSFWIPIYGLHHDSKYFPNPERFDPERFNEDNRQNINLNAYIPFGIGPRNCIGSRFALMEVKAIIYYILLNFQLIPNEKTDIPLQLIKSPLTTGFKNGMNLQMKPRKTIV